MIQLTETITQTGSSPRARGTRRERDPTVPATRIIPACAGNTTLRSAAINALTDHPRVRGEHKNGHSRTYSKNGSSPRARGTRRHARARRTGPADHPRVRGEHHFMRYDSMQFSWIIPACAGNTASPKVNVVWISDHPRVRGEHHKAPGIRIGADGSSPRARGTRHPAAIVGHFPRIIPACAGNTDRAGRRRSAAPDHPRVRGEHVQLKTSMSRFRGSSPRARGTHAAQHARQRDRRIIPACAGNTTSSPFGLRIITDHPRVRGEHSPVAGM